MKSLPPPFLDRASLPWLFIAALLTCLPHTLHHPLWVSLAAGICLGWRLWLWRRGLSLPSRTLKVLLVVLAIGAMVLQYRTLFGREAGTAFLFLLAALKLLELRTRRDAYALIYLCFFLLLAYFLLDQSLFTALWTVLSLLALVCALFCVHGGNHQGPGALLAHSAKLLLQALPFMLVMYLLFPRMGAPLWALPQDSHSGRTGLSEQMSPGAISNLAENNEIAFRARFIGTPPPRGQLYWRGPVFDHFDGLQWRLDHYRTHRPSLAFEGSATAYEITLEPHQQRWLLALDAPSRLPPGAFLNSRMTALAGDPVLERRVLGFSSHLQYHFNRSEDPSLLDIARQLPEGNSPRTRELARTWRTEGLGPEQLVQRALQHFRQENFVYTLQPPALGPQATDEFLFNTRKGFCEHYAGAFTVLMRAAGLPARVVTGYQGGEINPVDGFLVVRQSDAHAWSEVWIEGQGWRRVDPTSAISPLRIESGINAALPSGAGLPGLIRGDHSWIRGLRHRWDALNNAWNQWVLGYDQKTQQSFLFNLGLEDLHWSRLASWLVATCCALLLLFLAYNHYPRPEKDPARRLWLKALKRMVRLGIRPLPGETPLALARRIRQEQPAWGDRFAEVAQAYCEARFGAAPNGLDKLRLALNHLSKGPPNA